MKIERLDILAFGSLRDVSLELAGSAPCLHVVYGPNEAGKSTALRALGGLFYGIPENTKDAHSMEPSKLRVGAQLCDAQGRSLTVVRRKGRKDTLLSQDGQPLAAADAAWITAGVAESTFHALFGLSFATLHSGAEELLGSSGDLGQSLFSAALGGGHIRRLLEQLEAEAAELFKPRGKVQHLNAALALFDKAKKQSRDDSTKASTFNEQQAALEAAETDYERVSAQSFELRAERQKLERARRVLPLFEKQRALAEQRKVLGEVVRLALEAPRDRRNAEAARRDAQLRVEHAQAEVKRLEQELADVQHAIKPALAELHTRSVEALRDRLSGYRRCAGQLPTKREGLVQARAEVERARGRLQLTAADSAAIERLRLPKLLEVRVREHVRNGGVLRTRLTDLQHTASDKREHLERLRHKLSELWGPRDTHTAAPLLWRASLPSEAVCAEFEAKFAELAQSELLLARKRQDAETQLETNLRAREAMTLSGSPPTETDLMQLRAARAAAWDELRRWLTERPAEASPATLFECGLTLTEQCDVLADRLRREADRVARGAQLTAEQASIERVLAKLAEERASLTERRGAATADWQAHFVDAGLAPRSTGDARGLLNAQRALELQLEQGERELAAIERSLNNDIAAERAWQERWHVLARDLGLDDISTGSVELEALLEARSELLVRFDAAEAQAVELAALEREQDEFAAQTLELCGKCLPELLQQPVEVAAERLIDAHRKTHVAVEHAEQLAATLQTRRAAGEQAQSELEQTLRRLSSLMEAAGVSDVQALEAAEVRSARVVELDTALELLRADLDNACDGRPPEQVAAEISGSLDEVRVRLAELDERLEQLDDERQRATHQLASIRGGFSVLHEKHAAGDAAVEAMTHLEQVRGLTERYVRVRLAASVLKREITRYRERHRAPVLRAAGDIFQRLTLRAYAGLDVDYGDHDEPVLVCVRADDKRLTVGALSTGTRDQLYLALRLASIQHLAAHKEPMPLILDDILVHFDDERARAALVALSDFAATTQVLFFTHHQRLLELAADSLPSSRVRVHRLPTLQLAAAAAVALPV